MHLFVQKLPGRKAAVLLRGQDAAHTGEKIQQRDVEPVDEGIRKRTPWMYGAHGHPKGVSIDHQQQTDRLGNVDVIQTLGGLYHLRHPSCIRTRMRSRISCRLSGIHTLGFGGFLRFMA